MTNKVDRGKSNIITPYTKPLPPEHMSTDEIKVDISTDYIPSPERLAREAKAKQEAAAALQEEKRLNRIERLKVVKKFKDQSKDRPRWFSTSEVPKD